MSEQYKCQVCSKMFDTTDAVDGYIEGYKNGFLCPHCKSNLVEAGESDDIFHLKYGLRFAGIVFVIGWLVSNEYIIYLFSEEVILNKLLTALLVLILPTVIFLLINKSVIFRPRIIYTRKTRNKAINRN